MKSCISNRYACQKLFYVIVECSYCKMLPQEIFANINVFVSKYVDLADLSSRFPGNW